MEEWKEYKLGDFMEFNPKISLKKDTVARKITMDQLMPHSRDIYSWTYEPYSGGAKFQNGDTIMARITPCLENGKHAFISLLDENEIAYGSTEYIVMRGRKGISDNLFVYYLTHFPSFKDAAIKSMVGTSGRQRAQVDVLENMTMKLPSIAEQKSIADILTKLDDKIEVNRRINDNLEQQAQALFKSWFVDFEPFRDQPFVESELGMIPEGWKVGSFLDNIYVMPGGTPSTNVDEYWKDGTIPFFSPKDVNGVYCFETEKNITELGLNNCSSRLYPKDTLFITARGTVGKIALAGVPMAMNQSNYALAAKEGVGKFYLYLLTQTLVSTLLKKANGAVFSAITTKDFNEPNLIPANNVMDSFEVIVKPIFDKIFQTSEESRRLAELRDTLLPRLMSGELSVDGLKGQSAVSPGQHPGAKATSPGQHPGA